MKSRRDLFAWLLPPDPAAEQAEAPCRPVVPYVRVPDGPDAPGPGPRSPAVSWLFDATRPAPVPDPGGPFVVAISPQVCLPFCATCAERCPEPGALTATPTGIVLDPERCTGCARCVTLCPAPGRALRLVPAP